MNGSQNALISAPKQFLTGNAAQRLLAADFNVNVLRTNTLLRKDEWEELDDAVVQLATKRVGILNDLRAAGLVKPLGGLGTILTSWQDVSDMGDAHISMAATAVGQKDRVDFGYNSVPVPLIHKPFELDIRTLQAGRKLGDPIDTTYTEAATRKVLEAAENMVFNGATVSVKGYTIPGLCTHTYRNQGSAVGDFGTITNIRPTFINMIKALQTDRFYGPYMFYVANDQYLEMLEIYTDGSGESALDRVKKIPGVKDVKPSDWLTAGHIVGFNATRDTIDLAVAQDIIPVQWDELGGMIQQYMVFCAMVPRVKADNENKSGVAHFTGA